MNNIGMKRGRPPPIDISRSIGQGDKFQIETIPAVKYVDGKISTNGLEHFWSLLKRTLNGTYVSVEPFHLFRYVDGTGLPV